jgi:hypothetical protein
MLLYIRNIQNRAPIDIVFTKTDTELKLPILVLMITKTDQYQY